MSTSALPEARLKSLLKGMWHKKHRLADPEAPPGKRLRENLVDLYASGDIPGDRAQSLLEDAGEFARSVGSHELQDLRASAHAGGAKNVARDLRRRLLRHSKWPSVYVADVRVWSSTHKAEVTQKLAMLLPHEVIGALAEVGSADVLCQSVALDPINREKHQVIEERLQRPFVSVSLWGDGIPFSWDRKRSADVWTISFPGLTEKVHRDLRIPITSIPHECVTRATHDDVMQLLAWSFKALASGRYPDCRHDSSPWLEEGETWRRQRAGGELINGALIEVKGDWKQMHACFAVPSWMKRGDKPICWRCQASKNSLKLESGRGSTWLLAENRLQGYDGLLRLLEEGEEMSPLFSIPFMTMASLRIDWLHVADQGISAVFMGGLFHMVLSDRSVGPNEEVWCGWLWGQIRTFYDDNQTVDRLHTLTVTMVKPKKGSIELAGSGAQIRALIPFAAGLVETWPEQLEPEAFGARACMRHLSNCYSFLSRPLEAREETLIDHALAFHTTLRTLHELNAKRWQMRPKLHMFMELCLEGGSPSTSWNYREESFGGSLSRQSHRRGGFGTPLAMSRGCLTKFCAKEALPRLG